MKTLSEHIGESIFGNLGISSTIDSMSDFINNVPIMFDQYGTKYDKGLVIRDPKNLTITFQNTYSRDNRARNIVFDFSDYIEKLSKLDLHTTVLTFRTAILNTRLWPEQPTHHFGGSDNKLVVLNIETRCIPPVLDPNYDHIVKKNYNLGGTLVFKAARFVDDYDPKHIPSTDELMKSWTIVKNKL